jgi:hemolysin III
VVRGVTVLSNESLNRSTEELANGVSHAVGLLCAIAATPLLILSAVARGGAADIVGGAVFGASMVLLYLASTTFHLTRSLELRRRLQRLDHAAIFLLIAGTYTPFTLGVLGGPWGWTLFGLVWGTACLGIGTKLLAGVGHPRLSTAAYLVMGWLVIIVIRPLWTAMDGRGILWLVLGGLSYSVGVAFYSAPRLRYSHFVWHLFVLAGSTCHFFAALWYAA